MAKALNYNGKVGRPTKTPIYGEGHTPDVESTVTADELVNPAVPEYEPTGGWLPKNIKPVVKGFRTVTLGSPLVGALATAALAGVAGWHGGPLLDRILSPKFGGSSNDYYDDEYTRRARRKTWAWAAAALGGLAFLGSQFSLKRPGYGLLKYHPMEDEKPLQKTGSMYDGIPLGQATDYIQNNPYLSPDMRYNSLALLNSFGPQPNMQITGNDLVGQAIGTGLSAAAGAAVGYLTANVLGLPNPTSTAILGAINNTLGPSAALTTSMVFGH